MRNYFENIDPPLAYFEGRLAAAFNAKPLDNPHLIENDFDAIYWIKGLFDGLADMKSPA